MVGQCYAIVLLGDVDGSVSVEAEGRVLAALFFILHGALTSFADATAVLQQDKGRRCEEAARHQVDASVPALRVDPSRVRESRDKAGVD